MSIGAISEHSPWPDLTARRPDNELRELKANPKLSEAASAQEPVYEVFAIRYCHRPDALRGEMFYEPDARGNESMPLDYFTWIAVSGDTVVGIDSGFKFEAAIKRERQYIAPPTETMVKLGIDPSDVRELVLTHFHWDHTGNVDKFPNARIVLQEREMAFWTGRWAGRGYFKVLHDPMDLRFLLDAKADGRVRSVDGDVTLRPGVSLHHLAGHTPGMQVVRIATRSGYVVIASDASHYYANIEGDRPYRIAHSLPEMYAAFDRINELASRPELVVAGHDPLVLERFPAVSKDLAGLVVRIA